MRPDGVRVGMYAKAGMLADLEAVGDAEVEGIGLESFWMDVPVAVIPGSDPSAGEFIYSGHLDHPKESANDNGSGSAAMMDMAITIRTACIQNGRLTVRAGAGIVADSDPETEQQETVNKAMAIQKALEMIP